MYTSRLSVVSVEFNQHQDQGMRQYQHGTGELTVSNGIIHISRYRMYRLRLNDGRYIYMSWHPYCGPTIFKDKHETRWIENWYEDEQIVDAVNWFVNRGKKA